MQYEVSKGTMKGCENSLKRTLANKIAKTSDVPCLNDHIFSVQKSLQMMKGIGLPQVSGKIINLSSFLSLILRIFSEKS